jgi:heterodisulfide reductase subunit B
MEPLIEATGATVHEWRMGATCCGASNMNTKTETAIQLVADILEEAKGADAIVTVCPMCQINLEAYQKQASAVRNKDLSITILYLPQLLGLAFGISEKTLGIGLNLAVSSQFRNKIKKAA